MDAPSKVVADFDIDVVRLRDLDEAAFERRYACDRLTASILVNRFRYVNAHMATKLRTNAFSIVIRDMDDFCTTIQGPPSEHWAMPATSFTNPVHWGPVTDSVGIVLEEIGLQELRPGDVIACNDSYRTGKHLNDMSFIRPLFHDGDLIGAVHVTAHQLDVGSRVPGGFDPLSATIWEDGLVLTPIFLYREGEPVRATFSLIAANTRYPDVILADLQVINATLDLGEELLLESVAKYGIDAYLGGVRYACDVASEEMTRAIAELPDGTYVGEHVIGDDGRPGAPTYGVHVKVTKRGHRLEFDFSGTSEQSPTSLNCSWLDAKTGVIVALKELFDRRSVPSSGSLRNIDFLLPAESILNATPPTATMSYYTLVDAVIRATRAAFNPMVGEDAIAFDATFGNAGGHRASGATPDGTPWATSAVIANVPTFPKGASREGDADGYGLQSWVNMSNLSAEVLELSTPILLLEVEAVPDSSGPGAHRGGTGLVTTHQYLHAGQHVHGAPPSGRGAAGVCGGRDGQTGRADYFDAPSGGSLPLGGRPDPTRAGQELPGDGMIDAGAGAMFRSVTPSAGGWGDPFTREPALVVRDVRDGYVSVGGAEHDYGVVVVGDPERDPENLAVDEVGTAVLREAERAGRSERV